MTAQSRKKVLSPLKMRADIELALANSSAAQIARDISQTPQNVRFVLEGVRNSDVVWQRVGEVVGLDPRYEITEDARDMINAMRRPEKK